MRRSFRVASVFTGVAATAAAFIPVADAATTAPAAMGAAARVTPDVFAANCNTHVYETSELHLYYSPKEHHSVPLCASLYGPVMWGKGKRFTSYCAGAWSGYLYVGGQARHFTKGTHLLFNASVSGIDITNEPNGGLGCPY